MKKIVVLIIMLSVFVVVSIGFAATPIEVLNEAGIIQGDGSSFQGDKPLTRQEMVTILARISPSQDFDTFDYNGTTGFTDVPKGHWASKAIKYAKEKGITNGIGNSKFGLDEQITGKQAILFIAKTLGVKDAGKYYNDGYNIAYNIEQDTGISLKSMPLNRFDKPISRSRLFTLLIEGLRQKELSSDKKLYEVININIPPEDEIEYPSDYTIVKKEKFSDTTIGGKEVIVTIKGENDNLFPFFEITGNDFLNMFKYNINPNSNLPYANYDNINTYNGGVHFDIKDVIFGHSASELRKGNSKSLRFMVTTFESGEEFAVKFSNGKEINVGDNIFELEKGLSPDERHQKPRRNHEGKLYGEENVIYKVRGLDTEIDFGILFIIAPNGTINNILITGYDKIVNAN